MTPQNTNGLKSNLASISSEQKTAISRILVSVANADGQVDSNEIKQLQKSYTVLGIDKKDVRSDVDFQTASDEPVTVSLRESDSGFKIPEPANDQSPNVMNKPPLDQASNIKQSDHAFTLDDELIQKREDETTKIKKVLDDLFDSSEEVEIELNKNIKDNEVTTKTESAEESAFKLDEELIRQRQAETGVVKNVLSDIFSDSNDPEEEPSTINSESEQNTSLTNLLDEKHLRLFRFLMTADTWERSKIHEFCRGEDLMIDGALETINEWAFDHFNAPFVEDGEPLYVDIALGEEILDV